MAIHLGDAPGVWRLSKQAKPMLLQTSIPATPLCHQGALSIGREAGAWRCSRCHLPGKGLEYRRHDVRLTWSKGT